MIDIVLQAVAKELNEFFKLSFVKIKLYDKFLEWSDEPNVGWK